MQDFYEIKLGEFTVNSTKLFISDPCYNLNDTNVLNNPKKVNGLVLQKL